MTEPVGYNDTMLVYRIQAGDSLPDLAARFRYVSYAQIEDDARRLGFVWAGGDRLIRLADDSPDGAEASQLDDRPSDASGEPGNARPALLDTGEGRLIEVVTVPLADEVPDYHPELVPVTLATERRAVERRGDPTAPAWLADLGLDPVALVALLEVARSNERGAVRAVASVILADLADLSQLLDAGQ